MADPLHAKNERVCMGTNPTGLIWCTRQPRGIIPTFASVLLACVEPPGLRHSTRSANDLAPIFFNGVADFQAELAKANIHIPIIFMTGHGDIPMSVQAMKAGAIDFLSKPFRDQDMLGEQTRNGDVLILHRYALVWKILYQGIKQLFLLHNCRG